MDILEFINIYLDASEEVKRQIEETVNSFAGHPACLEEVDESCCTVP